MRRVFNSKAAATFRDLTNKARRKGGRQLWMGQWYESLQAYWRSDEFEGKKQRNNANRRQDGYTVYRGGRKSIGQYRRQMVNKLFKRLFYILSL